MKMTLQERMENAKKEFNEAKDKLEQVNVMKTQVEQRLSELRGQYQLLEDLVKEQNRVQETKEVTNV